MSRGAKVHAFALLTSAGTFFLLIAGALVTTTGSGLSVPDWPLSFGQFFPAMEGGVLFEHGHRVFAGAIGILTAALAAVLWRLEPRRSLRWLGVSAVGMVLVQAVLGGVTVLWGLPIQVSVAHAVLGQAFFCVTAAIALLSSPLWTDGKRRAFSLSVWNRLSAPRRRLLAGLALVSTLLTFAQLVLGAGLRHGGGLPLLKLHVVGALCVSAAVLALSRLAARWLDGWEFSPLTFLLPVFIVLQVGFGLVNLLPLLDVHVFIPGGVRMALITAHVALGALILAGCLAAALSFLRFGSRSEAEPGWGCEAA